MKCQQCGKNLTKYQIGKKNKYCSQQCDIDRRKTKVVNNFSEMSDETAYWAGFFYGDGYITKNEKEARITLAKKDYDHLVKCSMFIFGTNKVLRYNRYDILQVSDKNVCENLFRFGVVNKKTYHSLPIIPIGYEKHFIRGYFDADGWYSKQTYTHKNGKVAYEKVCLGLCAYLKDVLIMINSLLPVSGTISKKKNQELYELRWQSRAKIAEIREYINGPIRLERKWSK